MDYKPTINLPQTEFPMKAELPKREPLMVTRWASLRVYEAMLAARQGKTPFVLHDGPPYANGNIHIGHILNKVLKDIVVKSRAMMGYYTPYLPGWDCHGLPIELAVEKQLGRSAQRSVLETRAACRKYAEEFIAIQRTEFQRLGVLGAWGDPYRTMDYGYQAAIARQFADLVATGAVYSGQRPIYWCGSCRTALAEAEVEYDNHRSPSIFVKFRLTDIDDLRSAWGIGAERVFAVIWTTTPWTIPANLAIALHPRHAYVAVQVGAEVWIVAEELLAAAMTQMEITDYRVLGSVAAAALERRHAQHPLCERQSLLILGEHVTLDAGTGCVHTAPGHGQEDFWVGARYQLPPLSPVDHRGRFTAEAQLAWLTGLSTTDANPLVIEHLRECGALVHASTTEHQYPHCWRCHRPVIFRVTEQWFVSMEQTQLRAKALAAIDHVVWIPDWGRNRIHGMIENRPDWCLSRQRQWGVPLVAVRCQACGERGTTPELIRYVAAFFAEHGADYWYAHEIASLLPPGFRCPHCQQPGPFTKETDILDVWFDSGSSFAAALETKAGCVLPADLYLEGSDQHRGWFHSALLIAMANRGAPPYRAVLTHGFVVDGAGKKYSKSAKNYTPPETMLQQYGAEILRLWVAAEDYRNDIRVSTEILARLADAYRKIRNTWRFLLGNLHGFDPARDALPYAELSSLDRWMLHETAQLIQRCRTAYEQYEFHVVYHAVTAFCAVQLSARHFDISKDRLYCGATRGRDRRSAQTAMWWVGEALTRVMAPILSFTAEEVWDLLPGDHEGSVFTADLPTVDPQWTDASLAETWERYWSLRELVNRALEEARSRKSIGNALEAILTIRCVAEMQRLIAGLELPAEDLFIVSEVHYGDPQGEVIATSDGALTAAVGVTVATTPKCARCWKRAASVGREARYPDICARCAEVVGAA